MLVTMISSARRFGVTVAVEINMVCFQIRMTEMLTRRHFLIAPALLHKSREGFILGIQRDSLDG